MIHLFYASIFFKKTQPIGLKTLQKSLAKARDFLSIQDMGAKATHG